MRTDASASERVVVLAPFGRDAEIAAHLLRSAGYQVDIQAGLPALVGTIDSGAGAAVVAEEALKDVDLTPLAVWLERQPAWSDFPFVVLTRHGGGADRAIAASRLETALGNVTLVERPFHPVTLVSLVASAIRSRRRQYEARRLLDEIVVGALALKESEDHYRHTVELNPQVTWTARPDGQLDRVASRWNDWTGNDGLGASWGDAVHPDDLEPSILAWTTSCGTGMPYEVEHRIRMKSGAYRWMRSRAYPRRDDTGAVIAWYGTTQDIDEEKRAGDQQQLLIRELHHRVKNTLATVQAVMGSTARASGTVAEFQEAFSARIASLARTHTLLTGNDRQRVSFRELIEAELAPYTERERVMLSGPGVDLVSEIAVPLGMAIHELTTNAAKYGALSTPTGRISVDWRCGGSSPEMIWHWRERGGPTVQPPTVQGFGSKLLQRVLREQIGAEVNFDFNPNGLNVEARIPLALR